MILGDVATKARALTHTDITNYSDANLLIDINIWYSKIVTMILDSQDGSDFDDYRVGQGGSSGSTTNYPLVTIPMIAGQRDYYIPFSEKVLKIKRVDVTYDGTNYFRATPFDSGQVGFGMGNTTTEDANFIKQSPRYDTRYNAVNVYPLAVAADVSAGAKVRIEWDRNVILFTTADFTSVLTDSTQVPGIDEPWHPMLAYGAAYEFANANNLPQLGNIKQDLQDWEVRLRTAYGRKDLDTLLALQPGYDSYGDYGSTGTGYSYGR